MSKRFEVMGHVFVPCDSLSLRQDAILAGAFEMPLFKARQTTVDDMDDYISLIASVMELGAFGKIVGSMFKEEGSEKWSLSIISKLEKIIDDENIDEQSFENLQQMFLYCLLYFFTNGLIL